MTARLMFTYVFVDGVRRLQHQNLQQRVRGDLAPVPSVSITNDQGALRRENIIRVTAIQ